MPSWPRSTPDMFRAGLVLLLMTMTGAAYSAAADCDDRHAVMLHQSIRLDDGRDFSVVVRKLAPSANEISIDGVDIAIFRGATARCGKSVFHDAVEGARTARVDVLRLPWFHGVDVIRAFRGDASPYNYNHQILSEIGGKLIDVTPAERIGHTGLGGFYIGPLGHGRGNGLAVWDASWSDGDIGEPFPFIAILYRWTGSGFTPIDRLESDRKYMSQSAAEAFVGLPKGTAFDPHMP